MQSKKTLIKRDRNRESSLQPLPMSYSCLKQIKVRVEQLICGIVLQGKAYSCCASQQETLFILLPFHVSVLIRQEKPIPLELIHFLEHGSAGGENA
jgi:hypothetical protein